MPRSSRRDGLLPRPATVSPIISPYSAAKKPKKQPKRRFDEEEDYDYYDYEYVVDLLDEIYDARYDVADAKTAAVELNVKKIVDNRFLPKFFRNNTFTLILLIGSTVCYLVLKKRREIGIK